MDPRVIEHARVLVNWSTEVNRDEMVLIRASPEAHDLIIAVTGEVAKKGASYMVSMESDEIIRAYVNHADDETISLPPRHFMAAFNECDVIIGISAPSNTMTLSSVNPEILAARSKTRKSILDMMLNKRWCDTVHPCSSLAQQANMSLEEYRNFVYDAILIDWTEASKNMSILKDRLNLHKDIRFLGLDTDLYAETTGRIWAIADGKRNMPSGEVYNSPIEDSVEGKIYFDIPFLYQGKVIEGVRLRFDKGTVVDYSAEKGEQTLKAILEVDDGATRLGEIAMGMNWGISKYTLNMLFDEKIGGTIHCALGQALKECNGMNESAIHVDMIKNMDNGEILAGDETIYRDGKFFYES
ncbi:MAG: aminopeptidase [Candidatus Thorarchaeota archaeon]|jgi:aminopeptidase